MHAYKFLRKEMEDFKAEMWQEEKGKCNHWNLNILLSKERCWFYFQVQHSILCLNAKKRKNNNNSPMIAGKWRESKTYLKLQYKLICTWVSWVEICCLLTESSSFSPLTFTKGFVLEGHVLSCFLCNQTHTEKAETKRKYNIANDKSKHLTCRQQKINLLNQKGQQMVQS